MELTGCGDREISLLLVDDEGIREINRRYLERDYATNVISFSLGEGEFGQINPELLGDIVISVERAQAEAAASGIAFPDMMDFLMIHGLLHLLGYNHEGTDPIQARLMQKEEESVFFSLLGYELCNSNL
ncbi:MAG: rRNA maturation RNase YbeY [Deltaproteobacteria bacterium]|nr:rRNA maturation RNase YbeY [Deltaproteobacteria bacterium]